MYKIPLALRFSEKQFKYRRNPQKEENNQHLLTTTSFSNTMNRRKNFFQELDMKGPMDVREVNREEAACYLMQVDIF